jgi:uncharacterized protein
LKVFKRPGPVNTNETISILQEAKQELEFLVVASVTGDSTVKAAVDSEKLGLSKYVPPNKGV